MSDFTKIYKLSRQKRLDLLVKHKVLTAHEQALLLSAVAENYNEQADKFVENSIGCFPMPLAIVTDCLINDRLVQVPLAVEETSIVAGLNKTAKLFRQNKGIAVNKLSNQIIGQIYLGKLDDFSKAKQLIKDQESFLLNFINNNVLLGLYSRNGGAQSIKIRIVENVAILHLYIDPCDAMGANLINMALEALKPKIEHILAINAGVCIVSNYNDKALVRAVVEIDSLTESEVDGIVALSDFAQIDHYRATTHNKGIMNGVDAVLIATGNDWRAVEAGCHAFAVKDGQYKGLSIWSKTAKNNLKGELVMPINLGMVGGVTKSHELAKLALKIMQANSADRLSCIVASIGLMQNFAALHALSQGGIVKGHMKLHINNLIMESSATQNEQIIIKPRLEQLLELNKKITCSDVEVLLAKIRRE